jgi:hypothetical protein
MNFSAEFFYNNLKSFCMAALAFVPSSQSDEIGE